MTSAVAFGLAVLGDSAAAVAPPVALEAAGLRVDAGLRVGAGLRVVEEGRAFGRAAGFFGAPGRGSLSTGQTYQSSETCLGLHHKSATSRVFPCCSQGAPIK